MNNVKIMFVSLLLSSIVVSSSDKKINWNPVEHFQQPFPSHNPEKISLCVASDIHDKHRCRHNNSEDPRPSNQKEHSRHWHPNSVEAIRQMLRENYKPDPELARQLSILDDKSQLRDSGYSENPRYGRDFIEYSRPWNSSATFSSNFFISAEAIPSGNTQCDEESNKALQHIVSQINSDK